MEEKEKNIVETLLKRGYSNACAVYWSKELYNELYGKDKNAYSEEDRKWANNHGFSAEEMMVFSLNENNYKDFLSRKDYHILDPIDPLTKRLIDGKLTIYYSIGGRFPQYLPKYYCWIDDYGSVIPMADNVINTFDGIEDYLKKLLKVVKKLAIKPLTGAGGIGFVKLELKNGLYYSNDEVISNFGDFVLTINRRFVVTEFINQCKEFDEIWPNSAAALRVIAINTNKGPHSFVTYVRFGTKISKGACNLTSGGIGVPFDWKTGEYYSKAYRYFTFCDDGRITMDRHPDSGAVFAGKKIPHFTEVKKLVEDICNYLCVHSYFGFDILISNEGPKICEINSHPGLDYEQLMFGGVWTMDKTVQDFFRNKLSEKTVCPVLDIE